MLTVFSGFPLGLATPPGDTAPLAARLPLTYEPLLPLSRTVQKAGAVAVGVEFDASSMIGSYTERFTVPAPGRGRDAVAASASRSSDEDPAWSAPSGDPAAPAARWWARQTWNRR
ncbi:hypothetical protein ACFUG9_28280 [Streptomyces griseoincarnatus]